MQVPGQQDTALHAKVSRCALARSAVPARITCHTAMWLQLYVALPVGTWFITTDAMLSAADNCCRGLALCIHGTSHLCADQASSGNAACLQKKAAFAD